jgi:hypothetical protein
VKQDLEAGSSSRTASAFLGKLANGISQYAAEALLWMTSVNIDI